MTPAQRMVRAKGWPWLPGMRFTSPDVDGGARIVGCVAEHFGKLFARAVDDADAEIEPVCFDGDASRDWYDAALPDLTDPATLGAIEHGLLGPAGWWVSRFHDSTGIVYSAHGPDAQLKPWRTTLAEALADAVEALG